MPDFNAPDGTRLHFTDEGEGLPILALSGLTRNGKDFDYVAPHLAHCRLIRLDYRGRGLSEWSGANTYTVPNEAGDVLALLDHLGLDKVAILGTSRGGLIAMTLAATAKQRLRGVCLVDVGPVLNPRGLEFIAAFIGLKPTAKTIEEAAMNRAEFLTEFEDVPEERWLEEARKLYVQEPDGLGIPYDPALRESFQASNTAEMPDLWPLFDALAGLPLALIRGANSDLLSLETADQMSRRRPDMYRTDIPGRGHVPFLDEPEALAVLRDWTRAVESAA